MKLDWGSTLIAAIEGRSSKVFQLVAKYCDPKTINEARYAYGHPRHSALAIAALRGDKDIAATRLDRGADINQLSGDSGTPLQTALCHYKHRVAEILISRGAKMNNDLDVKDLGFLPWRYLRSIKRESRIPKTRIRNRCPGAIIEAP